MFKRIICDIILFFAVFFLAWWLTALLIFVFMILFKRFWEGIVAALFIDSLYSLPLAGFYGRFGIFTASAVVILIIIENIRPRIRI
jgi:hypothetical protein